MTVAPSVDEVRRRAGTARRGPQPLRWWTPAVAYAAAIILAGLVTAFGTNNGPLDDPKQA